MYYDRKRFHCLECNCEIDAKVEKYSREKFNIPLCYDHQKWLIDIEKKSSEYAIRLYFLLKQKGIHGELEKYDGHKHIDIAITKAKLNIEVDGQHHNYDPKQALADLKRTYYSYKKGYFTLRIPNSLAKIDNNLLEDTVKLIESFINEGKR